MNPLNTPSTSCILTLPSELNQLAQVDQDFVVGHLQDFVNRSVLKFVKGQKEHGGRITDRDCLLEMENETIDLFWYGCAEKERRALKFGQVKVTLP